MADVNRADHKYRCAYCKQMCASVSILMAHERDHCPKKAEKKEEWRRNRIRHTIKTSCMNRKQAVNLENILEDMRIRHGKVKVETESGPSPKSGRRVHSTEE